MDEPMMGGDKSGSGSVNEPLVPDEITEEFYDDLCNKLKEIQKFFKIKDIQEHVDNLERIILVCEYYQEKLIEEEKKCEGLQNDVVEANQKYEDVIELSSVDKEAINELRGVIEHAWRQKDAAQLREQEAMDESTMLREKMEHMDVLLQRYMDQSRSKFNDEAKMDDLEKQKVLKTEINDLQNKLAFQRNYINNLEETCQDLENKVKKLSQSVDETSSEAYKEKKRADHLEVDLNNLRVEHSKLIEQSDQQKKTNENLTRNRIKQNLQILSLRTNIGRSRSLYNGIVQKMTKLQADLDNAHNETSKYKNQSQIKCSLLKLRENELIKLNIQKNNLFSSKESALRKQASALSSKSRLEDDFTQLMNQMNSQEKEMASMRKLVDKLQSQIGYLQKERDGLKKDLNVEKRSLKDVQNLFEECQMEKKSLNLLVEDLYKKIAKNEAETSKGLNGIKKKMLEIHELNEKIVHMELTIGQKTINENDLKRQLVENTKSQNTSQEEMENLKNQNTTLSRQVEHLEHQILNYKETISSSHQTTKAIREEIIQKDKLITNLQHQIDLLEKQVRNIKTDYRKRLLGEYQVKVDLKEKKKENDVFIKSIKSDEKNIIQLHKEKDTIIKEKNTICVKLKRKSNECQKIQDKLTTLQKSYDSIEKQYGDSMQNIRLMKIEIQNLQTEKDVLVAERETASRLRHELLQIHRVLNQERIKGKALQEQLLTPINVHSWRILRGSNPDKMDNIHKMQGLQRRILLQNNTVDGLQNDLRDARMLYSLLKEFLLKLPTYKTKEKLNEVLFELRTKDNKLKALTAELNAKGVDERAKDNLLEMVKTNLKNTMVQLNKEKQTNRKLHEDNQFVQMQVGSSNMQTPILVFRTLGAGFKVNA